MKSLIAFAGAVCLAVSVPALASDIHVGSVKTARGAASIIRNRVPMEVTAGARVFRYDSLKTGSDGSIAMVFRDDTLLSIGPDSEIAVKDFLYSPAEGRLSFVARLLKGTAACVTGIIGKLSPQSFRFETPVANIGIRGTSFAVKVEDQED